MGIPDAGLGGVEAESMNTRSRNSPIDWKIAGALLASAATSIAIISGLARLVIWLLHLGAP